mmetsp:Transcript_5232/g.13603  ORF Transcript_5232/g.13603 Transcript_5232/m.13603 type:complete len:87 (-) Transcript_5232:170-430(-)
MLIKALTLDSSNPIATNSNYRLHTPETHSPASTMNDPRVNPRIESPIADEPIWKKKNFWLWTAGGVTVAVLVGVAVVIEQQKDEKK